ncbi:hypothetical protein PIB30_063897, partial [Stylosanthes scabra]|nr:hypothetical protein [Stylosanthes scabra]
MYFKISKAPNFQPFYLTSDRKTKFSLNWRMGYRSPRPAANALSEEEKKTASLLRSVWRKEHLKLKDLMCDDEIAKRMVVRFILAQSAILQKCLDLRSIGLPDSRLRICPEQCPKLVKLACQVLAYKEIGTLDRQGSLKPLGRQLWVPLVGFVEAA